MELHRRLIREFCRRASPLTERLGFALSPVHFYFPIPDLAEMRRRDAWSHVSGLAGVDWNEAGQLALLGELATFAPECHWPEQGNIATGSYGTAAPTFGLASALFAHAMVRKFRPAHIVEVGCGWSTVLMLGALALNERAGAATARFTAIDPYPPAGLAIVPTRGELLRVPVQDVPHDRFTALSAGDILFIDSSHVLNTGSDVAHLYLEVLPRLASGVVVHIHDIHLPFEYPREHAERQRWFWNEQYLLQAFLAHNRDWEVLLAGNWLCEARSAEVAAAFPMFTPGERNATGSFWMRRR